MKEKGIRITSLRLVATLTLVIAGLSGSIAASAADFYDGFNYTSATEMQTTWDGAPNWATFDADGITLDSPKYENRSMTSNWKGAFGTFSTRFMTTNNGGNQVWFGWRNRDPWSNPAVYVSMWDSFVLVTNNNGVLDTSVATPYVTTGVWHTLDIVWQPTSVELIYDGTSCGKVTNTAAIPQTAMTLALDSYRGLADPLTVKYDYVSVTSEPVNNPVPEPSSMLALLCGALGTGAYFGPVRKLRRNQ